MMRFLGLLAAAPALAGCLIVPPSEFSAPRPHAGAQPGAASPAPAAAGASSGCSASGAFALCVTPDAPETIPSLPIDGQKRVIASLPLGAIAKGELLLAAGEVELTNSTGQWASFCRAMILASDPAATTGTQLTEQTCENFNPKSFWIGRSDVHHLAPTKVGMAVIGAPMAAAFVNFLGWSNTDPPAPATALTVEKGYGRIQALRIEP